MRIIFTSATESYLANARILARSVKRHVPDAHFVLLFNDVEDRPIDWPNEPFDEVLHAHKIGIENFYNLVFRYSVIEFCTAVKGFAARYLLDRGDSDTVVYLDPDIEVFSDLAPLYALLGRHDTILTPHITDVSETPDEIESREMAALKHGTFNLGFFAIRDTANGRAFLDWWAARLLAYSDIDFERGLFTDQKWCNLAPYMFEGIHVLCERTYNAATWNMNGRRVTRAEDGTWLVNGEPLHFYHFSGFGHDFGWADRELAMFRPGDLTKDLWDLYKEKYARESDPGPKASWHWDRFANGVAIGAADRRAAKGATGDVVAHHAGARSFARLRGGDGAVA